MRFWELISICRGMPECLLVMNCKEYSVYWEWHLDYSAIVNNQDRDKLDAMIPHELCLLVLNKHKKTLYQSDGYIRTRKQYDWDARLTVVEVYGKFGGTFVEEVFEYGSKSMGSNQN